MAETRTSPAVPPPRNVALDNLRVVAMLLGLVTHGVLPYTATGIPRYPIRDASRHVGADVSYFAVHDFRMQLFFLLAGFAAAALAARRGVSGLVRNRLSRVALPLVLAVLLISPLMHILFAHHSAARGIEWEAADIGGWVGPNFHLWFLYYLLLCCAPVAALFALAPRVPARVATMADRAFRSFLTWRWKVVALSAMVVPVLWDMEGWWIDSPTGWLPDLTVYLYYLMFFGVGVVLYRHQDLLAGIGRKWLPQLAIANLIVLPLMLKLTVAGNWHEQAVSGVPPAWLIGWKAGAIFLGGLYTWLMIGGLLGLFQRHFTTNRGAWKYLAEASYWCYLAGFPLQTALQIWLAPYRVPILAEFLFVNVVTFTLLLFSYEYCVRQSWIGLMLNGKRPKNGEREAIVTDAIPRQAFIAVVELNRDSTTPESPRRRRRPRRGIKQHAGRQ